MENKAKNNLQFERRSYVKPAVHVQGDVTRLTKGDPGDKSEGDQIFWGDFVSSIELDKRFE
jgi:hypothetical protein